MNKIIELKCQQKLLSFKFFYENDWCRVFYKTDDTTTELGAQSFSWIKDKLVDYLEEKNFATNEVYEYNNLKLVWILSLSEKHFSLYGSTLDNKKKNTLFFVSDNVMFLPEIILDEADVENWLYILKKY